ncbi:MAG: hypothetical protein PHC64_03390 [Candidatus Gastranaerophilales bacterium]|nr:hypothetical protein [Candidatus Gastranaerophilales bacterium]
MNVKIRDQIKILLLQKGILMKELVSEMGKRLNKKYSSENLSNKLRNETITYKEILLMADILGYKINFSDKEN